MRKFIFFKKKPKQYKPISTTPEGREAEREVDRKIYKKKEPEIIELKKKQYSKQTDKDVEIKEPVRTTSRKLGYAARKTGCGIRYIVRHTPKIKNTRRYSRRSRSVSNKVNRRTQSVYNWYWNEVGQNIDYSWKGGKYEQW